MSARLAAVVLVAAVVAACGPKTSPTGGPTTASRPDAGHTPEANPAVDEAKDPLAAAVERVVTLYESIATLPPGGSCRDAATSIETWTVERAAVLVQVRDAARGAQAALVDGLFHDASPRLAAAMTAIDGHATRCASEPAFGAALTRLSTEAGR
ncbi:MAG TPA: hypothetical protein VM261_11845 [Kofleriaceae bacterium]|nr:hypothetical protein [Kofleriaceae bacterium]